jgi:uncharacterized iron-regulated membrane protein
MTIKKAITLLHLWVGLVSGLIIFIICITAAIWSFSPEIEDLASYRHVIPKDIPLLSVSSLKAIADKQLPDKKLNSLIIFDDRKKSAIAEFYGGSYYYAAYIDPYTGKVLKLRDEGHTFFRYVILGHYSLWLGNFGKQIVRWTTLLFLIMLISGIIVWWPRNKAARKQRFKIKLGTSPKRLNYDLHNVLGFYASWIILFAVLTAVVWTFDFARDAEYFAGSTGKTFPGYHDVIVKKQIEDKSIISKIDSLYALQAASHKKNYMITISFPADDSSVYTISVYPHKQIYDYDAYHYDQYTFKEVPVTFGGKYADANNGEKIVRMNYDIHIGNIIGLPGRIAMFFAVLVCASLPITGFYIWWGKNKKKKSTFRH